MRRPKNEAFVLYLRADRFVVVRFDLQNVDDFLGVCVADCPTIQEARQSLPRGLRRYERDKLDGETILETWI